LESGNTLVSQCGFFFLAPASATSGQGWFTVLNEYRGAIMARQALVAKLCLAMVVAGFLFVHQPVRAVSPSKSGMVESQVTVPNEDSKDTPEHQIAVDFSQNEIDSIAATLPEGEVRQMFENKIAIGAESAKSASDEAPKEGEEFARFIFLAEKAYSKVQAKILLFLAEPTATLDANEWRAAFDNLNMGKGLGHFFLTYLIVALMIVVGLAIEFLVNRSTEKLRRQILDTAPLGRLHFLGRVLSRLMLNILGLFTYILTTFVLFATFFDEADPGYLIVLLTLLPSYYIRFFILTANLVLSPAAPALRLFPLQDEDATFLYRWIIIIIMTGIIIGAISYLFRYAGISQEKYLLLYSMSGLGVALLLVVMIWRSRNRAARAIWSKGIARDDAPPPVRARIARRWHWYAIFYVLGIGVFWFIRGLAQGEAAIVPLLMSLFLIPIFIGLCYWADHLLDIAAGMALPHHALRNTDSPQTKDGDEILQVEETGAKRADTRFYLRQHLLLIKRTLRFLMLALMFFLILRLWGIDLPVGRIFTSTLLNIMGLVLFGIVAWQYIRTILDRKISKEMPDEDEEMEEGGAGGSRVGTLLVLLRKFILSVLFVFIGLIILQSVGVNIGPLILGAGVIGLAIGFGSQTLVTDILSGVFFLIDDAFRVGDYIEAGGVKGTVQHISLRTLKLRHPRGMVFTIPFGDLGAVKNYSRDYIISKLDFRVRYDTDVEKVRKVIKKKVYKKILANEELAPKLLAPIKSQGVRQLDDSAMIMRVKFKTAPGDQFALRKEVYRRMQEAFKEAGIEFAHRNVTVYMPTETTQEGKNRMADVEDVDESEYRLRQAAAAAATAMQKPGLKEPNKP
jgi:small-conductance mechanosensitive channel